MEAESDQQNIGAALAAIPSGCSIITCADGERSTGMLASWVQQAAFDPPAVTVAVKKGRPIQELLEGSGRLVLNMLADPPDAMFRHFGRGFSLGDDAFAGLEVTRTEFGVELADALAWLACELRHTVDAGDHVVYVATVRSGRRRTNGAPYVHTRKSGLSY